MAALRLARVIVAVHVSRAEGGKAPLLRRDPAQCRRLPAIPRRLSASGCAPAIAEPGMAYPFRPAAQGGHARDLPAAAHAGVIVECGECRDALGLHRPLSPRRNAAVASEAGRYGGLRHQLLS